MSRFNHEGQFVAVSDWLDLWKLCLPKSHSPSNAHWPNQTVSIHTNIHTMIALTLTIIVLAFIERYRSLIVSQPVEQLLENLIDPINRPSVSYYVCTVQWLLHDFSINCCAIVYKIFSSSEHNLSHDSQIITKIRNFALTYIITVSKN
jgi:hypothetical protein